MNLDDITRQLRSSSKQFVAFCNPIPDTLFFFQPADKWSIAQNVKHLIISVSRTQLAYSLPKFMVRLIAGKPNRLSPTYDELVDKYNTKLEQGGKAGKPFIPKEIAEGTSKIFLLNRFAVVTERLAEIMEKKWTNPQLDNYLAPHPLLGKITLRELGYFTIHHTSHHLEIIKKRL